MPSLVWVGWLVVVVIVGLNRVWSLLASSGSLELDRVGGIGVKIDVGLNMERALLSSLDSMSERLVLTPSSAGV